MTRSHDYDVVVVGSGYGGSVTAARLAPHARVLVLERGRRWKSGEFPTTPLGLARAYVTRRNRLGLWSLRLGRGTGNAIVSALGGASLVNYGLTVRPGDHVFETWPVSAAELAPYYERALTVLDPRPNPAASELGDAPFLDLVEPGRRVDLASTIDFSRCVQCGHCVPGCNHGAKRTLERTYLDLAVRSGAEIRTRAEVVAIRPLDGGHEVLFRRTERPRLVERVRARQVVLAAGTFGTLELLHACRKEFGLSRRFGSGMSMNGDALAFLANTPHMVSTQHGAPITTAVQLPFTGDDGRTRTLTIMGGRIPFSILRPCAWLMALVPGILVGRRLGSTDGDGRLARLGRRLRDLFSVCCDGSLAHSFMYKLDAQDAARGRARFDRRGRAGIDWPDYARDPILEFAGRRLEEWAARVGGVVVPNLATWTGGRGFGVHPLGGCGMGRHEDEGVVDPFGRVFRPGGGFHCGLRIADGSIVPSSLGVPPSLTIGALAERISDHMISELPNKL